MLASLATVGCRKSTEPASSGASATPPSGEAVSSAVVLKALDGGPGTPVAVPPIDAGPPAPKAFVPPKDLNVILLSIDSLRADMPWAGYERPIAPTLTELEKTCVSYTKSYSISSYTSMSVGGLLGGRIPSELIRDGYFFGTYGSKNLFFPELLKDAKVRTIGAMAHGYFQNAGFEQGFETWKLVPGLKWNAQTDENITGKEHEALAEKLLSDASVTDGRFFAWFHFMDPHDQYLPHPKEDINWGRKLRDLYDGEVTFTDLQVKKFLEFVRSKPWASRTAIIVTSDHGEALGEHGQYRHGFELWQNLVQVPLFFCVPGLAPKHIDAARSAIDLGPTIIDLFGLPKNESFSGQSLVSEWSETTHQDRDIVLDLPATSTNRKRRALIHGTQKIVAIDEPPAYQLFDLKEDPGELKPITKGEALDEMKGRLKAYESTLKPLPSTVCTKGCLEGTK
ncbi:MAG: sulfatase [Polyangiaceae bacterium]